MNLQVLGEYRTRAPVASIIVPTLWRPSIDQTLYGLANQTVWPYEVIIIGDGPIPEPAREEAQAWVEATVNTFKIRDTGILIGCSTEHTGNYGNEQRDLGTLHAEGEYVAFVDDDDFPYQWFLESFGLFRDGGVGDWVRDYPWDVAVNLFVRPPGWTFGHQLEERKVGGSNMMVRTELAKRHKWGDGRGHRSDWNWINRILKDERRKGLTQSGNVGLLVIDAPWKERLQAAHGRVLTRQMEKGLAQV